MKRISGKNIAEHKVLLLICAAGLLIRTAFILWGAEFYFSREDIFTDRDTDAWLNSIVNLIENQTYTVDLGNQYGYFARIPGYSFFIGFFYLLSGGDKDVLFPLLGWTQSFLDIVAIYLMYKIGRISFDSKKSGLILAFIYACYPFIIVWNPVAYSEWLGVFFLIWSTYFFVNNKIKFKWIYVGAALSLGVLTRPQLALLVPIFGLILIFENRNAVSKIVKYGLQYTLVIFMVYGSWPIRNYVNHDKIVLTQDITGFSFAGPDWVAFLQYIYSVKAEIQPQFNQILHNEAFSYPQEAFAVEGDSAKLVKAVHLAKNCASSFSQWEGYWAEQFTDNNCDQEVTRLFNELRSSQIAHNPFNFYIKVPFQNLKKAVFKLSLYDETSRARKLASVLLLYRTVLIILGLIGSFMIIKNKGSTNPIGFLCLGYFILWYLTLCFGTLPQLRNIEMRYLLPADVLLLIPAAYMINVLLSKTVFKRTLNNEVE